MARKAIPIAGLSRDDLLKLSVRLSWFVEQLANNLTTDEGDPEDTEDEFGIDVSEVIEMAHDNMIVGARNLVTSLCAEFGK